MSLIAAFFAAGPLVAQSGRITGTVTSAEGARPLPAAMVTVVGTSLRTVTGADGSYSIVNVPAGTHQVRATILGHAPSQQSVTVTGGGSATANFQLAGAAVALEGVVAIGYGERRVRDLTGSVQAVSEEDFNTGRVVSPEQLIQSKVAGVQVVDSNEPGGGMNIRIRGGTSVNASNEPLFVVDGVPLQPGGGLSAGRNPLNFINPNDIARMTVLKDASSTAIYGARGANGVVIIETKSGTSRAPQFEYSSSASTSQVTGRPDFLTAQQFRAVVAEHAPGRVNSLGSANSSWRDAIEQDGMGQEHTVAVSGSGDASSYRISLNFLDQSGVIQNSNTDRLSGALNYNQRLFNDRLSLRANVRGARTQDDFTPGGVLGAATVFDPTQPFRNGDGSFWENTALPLSPNNPLAELAYAIEEGTTYRTVGSLEARYRMPFLEALSGTVRLGYDAAQSERRSFYPTTLQSQVEEEELAGFVSRSNPREVTGLIDAFANYASRIEALRGDVDVTAGYSYEGTRGDYPYFELRGLENDLLGPDGLPNGVEDRSTLNVRETKLASFFGRVNYNLLDRYLFTLSVRRDGSSRFGPENQWGTFPAAAVAWRLTDESFFPELGWLSEVKLRGSWGVNGNQAIGDYRWISSFAFGDEAARVQFGDDFVSIIRPTAVDPAIKWEETTSFNIGMDFGMLDNRITGAVDYYYKDTDDLLFDVRVAAGSNLRNFVTTNVGEVHNRGLELSLNARVLDGGLTWDAGFNASTNRNRLVQLNRNVTGGGERVLTGGIAGGVGSTIQVLQPGAPVNAFYVYRHRLDDNGNPIYTDRDGNGTIDRTDLYEDVTGDGVVNTDDLTTFHSPQPTWILAHSSQFGFRNFDLSMTLRAYLGNYVYNNTASANGFYNLLNQAGGLTNLHSSVTEYNFVDPQFFSDIYVEDASFLRMDNLTLGYAVPEGFGGARGVRLFGSVQNVFTLTGYSGIDPTAGLNGIDNNIYPRSRTFTAGLSVGF